MEEKLLGQEEGVCGGWGQGDYYLPPILTWGVGGGWYAVSLAGRHRYPAFCIVTVLYIRIRVNIANFKEERYFWAV